MSPQWRQLPPVSHSRPQRGHPCKPRLFSPRNFESPRSRANSKGQFPGNDQRNVSLIGSASPCLYRKPSTESPAKPHPVMYCSSLSIPHSAFRIPQSLFLSLLFCLGSGLWALGSSAQPNIILIYTDDHGWPDIGPAGINDDLKLPTSTPSPPPASAPATATPPPHNASPPAPDS